MTNFLVSSEYRYLGQVPYFKENGLPLGYLVNKGVVGCGGTTLALEDDRDTIICVPFVELVVNKLSKHSNVFGVYEGVTVEDIEHYVLETEGVKKIICTYDSLPKVIDAVGYDYFLLVDELHLLFTQYCFRDKAIRGVLDNFKKFKGWSFLTATPIEEDLMLKELRDIPVYNIDWESKKQFTINAVKCKQIKATLKKTIEDFVNGKVFGNMHIFVNSVDFIAKMIKNCNLTNRNDLVRVIFSKNNEKYKNNCQGIKNSSTTDPVKKINFYTSTCFEGCDLYDVDAKVYIVSDSSKCQTLYDISTQVRQIAGRIRNAKSTEITHLYTGTRYNVDLTLEQFKEVAFRTAKEAEEWVEDMNAKESRYKNAKASEFLYVYKENKDSKFEFDINLVMLDIFNYKNYNHTYSLYINTSNEYTKAGMTCVISSDSTSDALLKDEDSRTTFKDAIVEYKSIKDYQEANPFNFSNDDEARISLLKAKYPFIEEAYEKLGMDKIEELKYKTSSIKRELIKVSPKDMIVKVAKYLKTVSGFEEGNFVSGKRIKEVLNAIYKELGLEKKATVDDFRQFAVIDEKKKRIDGNEVRGYIIQYIKIKRV